MSDGKMMTGKVEKSEAEWRQELTPMQYAVLREKATERPGTGEYEHENRQGTYICAGCGQTLFESVAKFSFGRGARPDPVRIRRQFRFRLRLAELHRAGGGQPCR